MGTRIKRKKTHPKPIADILSSLFANDLKLRDKAKQYQLWEHWDQVVGPKLAQHAQPIQMQGDTLLVSVTSPSWLQELQMMQTQLLEKIRAKMPEGKIGGIKFILKR